MDNYVIKEMPEGMGNGKNDFLKLKLCYVTSFSYLCNQVLCTKENERKKLNIKKQEQD